MRNVDFLEHLRTPICIVPGKIMNKRASKATVQVMMKRPDGFFEWPPKPDQRQAHTEVLEKLRATPTANQEEPTIFSVQFWVNVNVVWRRDKILREISGQSS
jgi:hypothetical protein